MTCCPDASFSLPLTGHDTVNHHERLHEEELKNLAKPIKDGLYQNDFTVQDMHCAACLSKIEKNISKLHGVHYVRANLSLKRVSVQWMADLTSPGKIQKALTQLGFTAMPFDVAHLSNEEDKHGKELVKSLAVSGFASMNIMLLSVSVWSGTDPTTTQLFHLISGIIAVPAVLFAGRPFYISAWRALRAKRLNMDVPISLAVLLALMMSIFESLTGGHEAYFDASVMLLFFLLIGRTLDHMMRKRARGAIERLASLTGKGTTVVLDNGQTIYQPADALEKGMTIRLLAGERVPVDGEVLSSLAEFDRSMITGESTPTLLKKRAIIEAGALNLTGLVDIKALKKTEDSFVAEVVKLMEAAEGGRSRYIRVADRMAAIYAPSVHLLALFAFIGWMFWTGGNWHLSLYTAISVLIITCPCALGLAVPVVHVIAATRLFKEGILMKDGSSLERLSEIDTVLFDKTGTLTTGHAQVDRIEGNENLLPIAASLCKLSKHPSAQSIALHLKGYPNQPKIQDVQEIAGSGLETTLDESIYRLGRSEWVAELNPNLKEVSGVVLANSNGESVSFNLTEELLSDAKQALFALKDNRFNIGMVSGDNEGNVSRLAQLLKLDYFSANNRPEDKVTMILDHGRDGKKVLMVGDGLNDAAALSAGHASMAPASACDIGRLAADFVFTRNTLFSIPSALKISTIAARLVRQNFGLAIIYNCIAVPLATLGYVTPLIAALAMSCSSIVVILNSLRLNLYTLDWKAQPDNGDILHD